MSFGFFQVKQYLVRKITWLGGGGGGRGGKKTNKQKKLTHFVALEQVNRKLEQGNQGNKIKEKVNLALKVSKL